MQNIENEQLKFVPLKFLIKFITPWNNWLRNNKRKHRLPYNKKEQYYMLYGCYQDKNV